MNNGQWPMVGENGFLTPTNEEKFLAKRILEAMRNQALLEKSHRENLCIIKEKALWPVTIEKMKEIYTEILSSKN